MLAIKVRSVGTAELDFDLPPAARVVDLKRLVAGEWQIPVSCQRMFAEGGLTEIANSTTCGSLSETCLGCHGPLVCVVMTLDSVLSEIHHPLPSRRKHALEDLGILGTRGGQQAVKAVASCLADGDVEVRTCSK
eukprot:TRINITY_DN34047_c0_g1_i1.p1 TRINITY_DN34047_c0_g1~~TRINITY_DN34047_c0_g1_i1.p1  ORF type:complete len:134 (-),score=18.88 TRINITY_DN34047_c0_g1_i1:63-464(-)